MHYKSVSKGNIIQAYTNEIIIKNKLFLSNKLNGFLTDSGFKY